MFIYIGGNLKLRECVDMANDMMINPKFRKEVEGCIDFDMTEPSPISGSAIYRAMRDTHKKRDIIVNVYYPWYRFSKALGYFSSQKPFDINLNGYKLKRSGSSIVATLIHELVHMADNLERDKYYGHGNNSSNGKSETAPYKIDNIAEIILGESNPTTQNYRYKKRFSLIRWLKKLIS